MKEQWIGNSYNIQKLGDLKSVISAGIPASNSMVIRDGYFFGAGKFTGKTTGTRWRTFFLCSLTGEYIFYFSCYEACEWVIKESENSEGNITGGISALGMTQDEFIK